MADTRLQAAATARANRRLRASGYPGSPGCAGSLGTAPRRGSGRAAAARVSVGMSPTRRLASVVSVRISRFLVIDSLPAGPSAAPAPTCAPASPARARFRFLRPAPAVAFPSARAADARARGIFAGSA